MENGQGSRIRWNDEKVEWLLEGISIEQTIGNWSALTLSKNGYKNVITYFAEKGINLSSKQIKNKFDILKKDFATWNTLKHSATGLGLTASGTIAASEEWWDEKKRQDKNAGQFQHFPLPHEELMYRVFQNTVPSTEYVWSSGQDMPRPQTPVHDNNNSDDEENIEITPPPSRQRRQSETGSMSGHKRKSSDDLISAIQEFGQRRPIMLTGDQDQGQYDEALAVLDAMDIEPYCDLYFAGLRAFERATKRITWMRIRTDEGRRRWLVKEMEIQGKNFPYN